jgi:hypothetical protein
VLGEADHVDTQETTVHRQVAPLKKRARLAALTMLVVPMFAACATLSLTFEGDSPFELKVGQCFDAPDDSQLWAVEVVPCNASHENEIFAAMNYPAGPSEPFPGDKAIASVADQDCVPAFEAYVGVSYEASRYLWAPMVPTESSWADGDREILCVLYLNEGASGSAKGSRE